MKNPGTAQTRAAAGLRSRRRLALTGTPVENRLGDLWSIMQLLNPGLFGPAAHFRERFALRRHSPASQGWSLRNADLLDRPVHRR